MIPEGYILQPRIIRDSDIMKQPPHFREIWFYLLREANHKDTKVCKRGELVRTYANIIEALSWYVGYRKMTYKKHHCEKAMKWLTKEHMVETTKTTRGILIKVLQYDRYQDPKNYESDNESDKKATRKRQWSDTINKNDKNVKNEKNVNKISSKEDRKKPDTRITELITHFEELLGHPLDDTQKNNRFYCYNLLRKIRKQYPDKDEYNGVKILIEHALNDPFHSKNTTTFKYLFYNLNKVLRSISDGRNNLAIIN